MTASTNSRILVVDDTKVSRLVITGHLTKGGYEVVEAEGGAEALELLGLHDGANEVSEPPFAAVVLDIMMPNIDGLEVLRRVRAVWAPTELPVVMATAIDQSEDIVTALDLGASDYVSKPIDIPVLLARLRTQVDLRQTHKTLKEAQKSLIDAAKVEAVGYLAAGLAHELRNPLAQLSMGLDLIKSSDEVLADKGVSAATGIMEKAIGQADEIVCSVMEVTRSGSFALIPESINDLVEKLVLERAPSFKEVGITHCLNLEEAMPEVLMANSELGQAISNVIDNAVEAMPEGGELSVSTRVTEADPSKMTYSEGSRSGLGLRPGDEVVVVEVTDSGWGIPNDALPNLFDSFYSLKPTGRTSGKGLGLSVAKKVIELHNGTIAVKNRQQSDGVSVTIELPTARGQRASV